MNFLGDSSLTGQIVDTQTTLPIRGAAIVIQSLEEEKVIAQTITDDNGEYLLLNLPSENVKVEITALHYHPESKVILLSNERTILNCDLTPLFLDPCRNGEKLDINCYLTEADGTRKKTITFTEIGPRSTVQKTLTNGQILNMQKITALIKGFVVVEVETSKGTCKSTPIFFQRFEQFILYAPEGTGIDFTIDAFDCEADIICEENEQGIPTFQELTVSITLGQHITSYTPSIIEMKGTLIQPRSHYPSPTLPYASVQKTEALCINIKKVYDWTVRQRYFSLTLNRDSVSFYGE
ncbi:carboxypeptidase regulatory-like domain-containing protein [Metabacillus iocasae]|uniref:Carboxypeptidase regulatory-like domain-containing protein n=1 Tax=Priestia iocasae TaxID=2291674 RepID=A0ABS2QUG2_9BACI|nr:hypothetical protein [Metabacillus iocasae]